MAINIGGNTVKNKSDGGQVIYNGKECTEVWYKSSPTATAVKVWPENDGYAYLTQNHWPDLKSLGGNCINHSPVWVPALKIISESNPNSTYYTSANIPAKVPFTQKIFPVLNKSNAKLKYWTLTFPDGTTQRFDDTNEHTFTFSQAGDYIENSYWDTNPEPEEKKYYIDVICYPAASYTNKWTLTSGNEPVYEKDVTSIYNAKFPGCSAKRYKTELGMKMSVKAPVLTDAALTTMKSTTTWGTWPGPGSDENWSDRGTSGFDVIISDNPNREVDDYQGILYTVTSLKTKINYTHQYSQYLPSESAFNIISKNGKENSYNNVTQPSSVYELNYGITRNVTQDNLSYISIGSVSDGPMVPIEYVQFSIHNFDTGYNAFQEIARDEESAHWKDVVFGRDSNGWYVDGTDGPEEKRVYISKLNNNFTRLDNISVSYMYDYAPDSGYGRKKRPILLFQISQGKYPY